MNIRVVTDTTSDLPDDVASALGIAVVPVYINIGDRSYTDGVDLSRREFYRQLASYPAHPQTAAPSTGAYAETYRRLAEEGATDIISVHIAADLSAIYNAARLGAAAVDGVRVHLVDSGQITLGTGWLAIVAAELAREGRTAAEIVAALEEARPRIKTIAALDTLEYLRRGGRVNWAQFGVGTLLRIKPILAIGEGEIVVRERVRTRRRSVDRLPELAAALGPLDRLAIVHADAREEAEALRETLQPYFPPDRPQYIVEVTPAIGTHVGPGALGFTALQAA